MPTSPPEKGERNKVEPAVWIEQTTANLQGWSTTTVLRRLGDGEPGEIRTHDFLLKRELLLPAELPVHKKDDG